MSLKETPLKNAHDVEVARISWALTLSEEARAGLEQDVCPLGKNHRAVHQWSSSQVCAHNWGDQVPPWWLMYDTTVVLSD